MYVIQCNIAVIEINKIMAVALNGLRIKYPITLMFKYGI